MVCAMPANPGELSRLGERGVEGQRQLIEEYFDLFQSIKLQNEFFLP